MNLAMVGVNFRTAPMEMRERLAVTAADLPAVLARIGERLPGCERVLICTCNRTELYVAGDALPPDDQAMAQVILDERAPALAAAPDCFYGRRGHAVAEHLMAVASSLDSMVVGENEVLGQVKQAYVVATGQGAVGPALHLVFQSALRVAKQVHSETDINRGRVSVSSIAVDFAERIFEDLSVKTVMIVGAGETAELALRSLSDRGVREVLVLNRSLDRATALAQAHSGKAIPFELLSDYLERADVVLTSTGASHALVRAGDVRLAMEARRGRPMLMVDLSMPRNIEPAVGELPNVYLYHLDDLQKAAAENLASRGASVENAWDIVRAGARELAASAETTDLSRLLQEFEGHAVAIRDEAVRRCLSRPALASLSEEGRAEVTRAFEKSFSKFLAPSRDALKSAARNKDFSDYARIVRDLFRLGRGPEDRS